MRCPYCGSFDLFWDSTFGNWLCNACDKSFDDEGRIE